MKIGRALVGAIAFLGAIGALAAIAAPTAFPSREMRTVRITEGTELLARLSPDGRKIAFIELGEVFVVDRRGGGATRLTNAAGEPNVYTDLAWAPDSKRLVTTVGARGFSSEARIIDVGTKRTHVAVPRSHSGMGWMPDGKAVFIWMPGRDSTLLLAYPADGTGAPQRVGAVRGNRGYFTVAPSGKHFAFAPATELDLATMQTRVVVDSFPGATYPEYSPDGQWIVFLSERSGTRQVWLAPRSGGAARMLTRDVDDMYNAPLSWTPDGRQVLYTAAGQLRLASVDGRPDEVVPFSAEFKVARWSGMRQLELPAPGETRRARGVVHPQISPDGRMVVFGALGDLWIADVNGGAPRRLTETPWADETFPQWSPDGKQILFAEDVLGQDRRLRIVDAAGGVQLASSTARAIAAPRTLGQAVRWSPDGRRLAFFAGNAIGWIDVATGERHVVALAARSWDNLIGWSADGAGIVYATARASIDTVGGYYVTHTLRQVSAGDSGHVGPFPAPSAYAVRGAWTPDLAWAAFDSGGVGYYVRVADAKPRRIADAAPRQFSWSRDGRKLLYLSGSHMRLLDVASGVARTVDVAPTYRVAPAPPAIVIRNVRVIDGRGTPPSAPADVFLAGGRISRVVPAGQVAVPNGTQIVDGAGRTLLPGLFDAHVHHTDGAPIPPTYAYNGVLAIRDVGTTVEWMQAQRERAEAGDVFAPRIFLSGGLLVSDAGQGYEPTLRDYREVTTTDSALVTGNLDELMSVGSDVVKFNIRDARLEATASRWAHARGQRITSHYIYGSTLAAGLDGKEHAGLYIGTSRWRQDLVATLQAAGTCVTPTLVTDAYVGMRGRWPVLPLDTTLLDEPAMRAFIGPEAQEWMRELLRTPATPAAYAARERGARQRFESVRDLARAGVPLMSGTDVGYWGQSLLDELELLVKAGLSPLEAIRSATLTPARCIGVDHALGSVEPGKLADLILVDGDPSTDIHALRRISLVVLGGRPYTRQEILARGGSGR